MASSPPQYVRCKALSRVDTEDDQECGSPRASHAGEAQRKQSRIVSVVRKDEKSTPIPSGDLSEMFTVPKASYQSSSMFRNLHYSQFDRGLYQTSGYCQMNDSESLYDAESIGNYGSVKMGVSFDENLNLLTVSLRQAIDLNAKRQDGHPNPYFRVSLDIPSNNIEGQPHQKSPQQSKTYKDTSSPILNDEFYFQVTANHLNESRLEVSVYDYDQFSVDECIGYCWLTLGRLTVSNDSEAPTVFWAEILPVDDNNGSGWGEVLFSLTYLSKAQRLTVNMFKARNLCTESIEGQPAIAIRVTLLNNDEKRLKRKKTSTKKNTRNPQFNESLTFGIAKSSLCEIILEIEAIHEYGTFGMGCKVLGKMELPLHKCKELWRAIIREEKSKARWYCLDDT
ncbi:Synaptotagmin-9 [Toxocara canis]|uniref:Synaptotagmin-9 n=1 Tax=Toxocara canis TaxID=6265 RepID=A0A0B2UY47_TOXCA|nr:Synaptotagmin-9 [Toxocara canis]